MIKGIITKGVAGFYYVKTSHEVYECKPRGIFRKTGISPLPGDRVQITNINENDKTATIEEIHPRKSILKRPAVVNVDQIAVVISVKSPLPDFLLLDKLLVTAEYQKIKAFVIINKIDLDSENNYSNTVEIYESAGYEVLPVSGLKNKGFKELNQLLNDKISVFAGQSGVGKSTILNNIMNSNVMKTGDLSTKNRKGKHTTRHAELIKLKSGGYVVDTPGFSSYELNELEYMQIGFYYPEFKKYINQCKYRQCSHISEPHCAVKDALNNREINNERYKRYVQIYDDMKQKKKY